ncbi:MAG: Glu-tRNA(Gln) amidotransferase subunit GatE, partial [bacterium]|nr:Glu-tRNA(Gln) amidotransferase subunit GatE [bacterium]
VCLVELDEEPPHPVNRNALQVVLQVGLVLNARVVDEIQVMRKTVIDGSNTAGFQRTMLCATDGVLSTEEGDVTLQYFCLEEDAARIIETNEREVKFRLDRLGIPLLEIVTGPNFISPKQGGEVADKLGHIIRSLNVRRGIGTIRQDVNVSTKYGTRIEIKGVQKHRMIPLIMSYEAQRQVTLYNIGNELGKLREKCTLKELKSNTFDVSDVFRNTESNVIKNVLDKDGSVTAFKIPEFRGILGREICPGKRLGTEFKDQVLTLGIKGLIHSDEDIGKYGISEAEEIQLKNRLNFNDNEAYVFFASKKEIIDKALEILYRRTIACFDGVPKESRRGLSDGNTQFMRPLPGEARMYPETDIPPVIMTEKYVEEIRESIPEILDEKISQLSDELNIPEHDLWKIEEYFESFIYGIETLKLKPSLVFNIIACNVVDVRRRTGKDFEPRTLNLILDEVKKGTILKEAVPETLEAFCGGRGIEESIDSVKGGPVDLDKEISKVLGKNKKLMDHPKRRDILMGELMKKLRGKVDGKVILKKLEEALKKVNNI